MIVHSKNKALMCKMFPSSLGPVAMRWFDGLEAGSISSFIELLEHLALTSLLAIGFLDPWIPYCP